jgi:hypothetical protein
MLAVPRGISWADQELPVDYCRVAGSLHDSDYMSVHPW